MSETEQDVVVLVADDEPSTLALVASHVRSKGYRVLEASDGDQAWQLAHEHLPDLVILDVMMPGMSGWEVCRKIREAVSLAHTGVIMLTGIGENLNEMTSPLYGADAYLDKPFEFADLDAKVTAVLAERREGAMGRPDPEAMQRHQTEPPPAGANGMSAPVLARPVKAVATRGTRHDEDEFDDESELDEDVDDVEEDEDVEDEGELVEDVEDDGDRDEDVEDVEDEDEIAAKSGYDEDEEARSMPTKRVLLNRPTKKLSPEDTKPKVEKAAVKPKRASTKVAEKPKGKAPAKAAMKPPSAKAKTAAKKKAVAKKAPAKPVKAATKKAAKAKGKSPSKAAAKKGKAAPAASAKAAKGKASAAKKGKAGTASKGKVAAKAKAMPAKPSKAAKPSAKAKPVKAAPAKATKAAKGVKPAKKSAAAKKPTASAHTNGKRSAASGSIAPGAEAV